VVATDAASTTPDITATTQRDDQDLDRIAGNSTATAHNVWTRPTGRSP
jgi:hypothetical protein